MVPPQSLVYVVDDEEAVRKALRRLLSASGLGVQVFADGADFVDAVAVHRPDCLVIDLHMPGMTGLDVLRHLANLNVKVPAIVITAHDETETRSQCELAGAHAYLCKPLDARALLDAIDKLTSRE
jgi:FixJ family two-component response regulator